MGTRNVVILSLSQAFSMCGPPLILLVGGIVGAELAPNPTLATLPLSLGILGLAVSAIPAALIMKRIGRRRGFAASAAWGVLAALLAAYAVANGSFLLFCLAAFMVGMNNAFVQQYRFAAAESVAPNQAGRAVSFVLVGGVAAGILGPEIGKRAKDLLEAGPYVGSFASLALIYLLVFGLALLLRDVAPRADAAQGVERPLRQVVLQPAFLLAMLASCVAYGVMSFIMTATPAQMHVVAGHSLDATTLVIQSHIVAMFLPSLATGLVIERLGVQRVMAVGLAALSATVLLGMASRDFIHYWGALVLLGLGWNFLFIGGTTLLTRSYRPAERFKAQAVNDFTIFGVQAAASISAGAVLFQAGWRVVNLVTLPALLALFVALLALRGRLAQPAEGLVSVGD